MDFKLCWKNIQRIDPLIHKSKSQIPTSYLIGPEHHGDLGGVKDVHPTVVPGQ